MKKSYFFIISILTYLCFPNNSISQNIVNKIGGTGENDEFQVTDSAGDEKLVVQGNGNVGIGTTTPSEALEVNGNVSVSGTGMWHHSGALVYDNLASPTPWTNLDLSGIIGSNYALVLLKVKSMGSNGLISSFRPDGDTDEYYNQGLYYVNLDAGNAGLIICETGSNGIVEWRGEGLDNASIWLMGFIK